MDISPVTEDQRLIDYANGSYSTSDTGSRGDQFALSPRMYPVPDYLRLYEDLRTAMNIAVDTCALQQGPCWVLKRSSVPPACGQCNSCDYGSPGRATGLAGAPRCSTLAGWRPVAVATKQGIGAVLPGGCVLPFWQRIFHNSEADHFTRGPSGLVYQAAVRAAMFVADKQRRPRVVCAECPSNGQVVPLTYVHPGGVVRSARAWETGPTTVERLDRFEFDQYRAASRGASLMPFGM